MIPFRSLSGTLTGRQTQFDSSTKRRLGPAMPSAPALTQLLLLPDTRHRTRPARGGLIGGGANKAVLLQRGLGVHDVERRAREVRSLRRRRGRKIDGISHPKVVRHSFQQKGFGVENVASQAKATTDGRALGGGHQRVGDLPTGAREHLIEGGRQLKSPSRTLGLLGPRTEA